MFISKKKQFIAVAHYKAEKNGDHLDLLIRECNQPIKH